MKEIKNNLAETIGCTPVLKLQSDLVPQGKSLYLKMECFNPTFSIKDRTAFALISSGFSNGKLKRGGTVIESTSGNLGKSLAMLGSAMNFKVIVVVDPKVSQQNLAIYKAFGAEVIMVDTPDENGSYQKVRIKKVQQLLQENPGAYWPNQYENIDNRIFHYNVTASEILGLNCKFDTFVGSVSTGGHLCGIAGRLKMAIEGIKIVAVDAVGSAIFQDQFKPHLLNGIGLAWRTKNVDMKLIDEFTLVGDAEAFSLCRHLAKTTGLLLGGSSGAVVLAGLNQLYVSSSQSALCIVADTGWNYLEQFYNDDWLAEKGVTLLGRYKLVETLHHLRSEVIHKDPIFS